MLIDVHEDDASRADRQVERARLDELAVAHAQDFVGKTASAAKAHADFLGLTLRLLEGGWRSSDYSIGRVTADLVNGLIVNATPG